MNGAEGTAPAIEQARWQRPPALVNRPWKRPNLPPQPQRFPAEASWTSRSVAPAVLCPLGSLASPTIYFRPNHLRRQATPRFSRSRSEDTFASKPATRSWKRGTATAANSPRE